MKNILYKILGGILCLPLLASLVLFIITIIMTLKEQIDKSGGLIPFLKGFPMAILVMTVIILGIMFIFHMFNLGIKLLNNNNKNKVKYEL